MSVHFSIKENRGTNGHGQGKWHSRQVLHRAKLARRKANKLARKHRAINRRTA